MKVRSGKIFSWEAEKENKRKLFDIWPLATVNESIHLMRYCLIVYITIR